MKIEHVYHIVRIRYYYMRCMDWHDYVCVRDREFVYMLYPGVSYTVS